ncbi:MULTISPECIES: hypothetical protein [unclassified Arthrobacter]|uniref:hypothetical protein n=1 Tax=unclassified Arthrobacter TaxID=235627 RepID=UPI001E4CF0F7|nr:MULTISPECIES: hypothetical protein [unclassified Arthrobacter]MCC9146732.1 hypothetical protein [Arthrobacter sp. zg-Y919]MDK1277963.1 hypothetical protein [Arthrobacter sp. zg.Y919]WIB03444.1 hypothetical protein QNO10_01760 [Arthrobacter sp. zg-Y919]
MDTNESQPTIAQLRARQTDLVMALATESRTDRLQQYSDELEYLVKYIKEREEAEAAAAAAAPASAAAPSPSPSGDTAPQADGVEQREDGVVIEPGSDLEADVDRDNR